MIRKLTVVFLSGLMCLITVASVLAMEYKEAPMLRVKVAAGELPPVKERLPKEPLVIEPVEEIGQYGGVWRGVSRGNYTPIFRKLWTENLVCLSSDFKEVLPNIAKGWKFSEEVRSITFFLRKGIKWSDGASFTADDCVFYWNDIILNKDIYPITPSIFVVGGEPGRIEKIDDYTFKLSFVEPYGMILENLITCWYELYAPKHYLKQFHPKYTSMDKLKKLMEKEKFDRWTDLFMSKFEHFNNPESPQIDAWIPQNTNDQPIQIFTRNPYYWKIDTKGNQLPYIDESRWTTGLNPEAVVLKVIAGEIDCLGQGLWQDMERYSFLMQNREKGDYRIILFLPVGTNNGTLTLNFFHKDPVIRKLFRDKQFRIALSISINRDEINEFFFKGMGIPSQAFPPPGLPWYEERFCKAYTEYNPEKANKILDEIGLAKRNAENYRLWPDKKEELKFVLLTSSDWPHMAEISDLIKGYLKRIGIRVVVKPLGSQLLTTRIQSGDYDIMCTTENLGFVGAHPVTRFSLFPMSELSHWAKEWVLWFTSEGKEGEEPPADVKRLMEIRKQIIKEGDKRKRIELVKEALSIHAENLWEIGVVTEPLETLFGIAKNNFRNVPKVMNSQHRSECSPQFFIKK